MASRNQDRSERVLPRAHRGRRPRAGLTIIFAPRLAAQLRQRVTASASEWSDAAVQGYQDAAGRVAGAVDRVTGLVDDATKRGSRCAMTSPTRSVAARARSRSSPCRPRRGTAANRS